MRILFLQEGRALLLQPLLHLFRVHGLNINIYVVFLKNKTTYLWLTLSGANCGSGNGGTVSGIFILDATTTPKSAYFFTLTTTKQDGIIIGIGSKTQRS